MKSSPRLMLTHQSNRGKIICLRRTTQTSSKQALPPFNALFMEKQDREKEGEGEGEEGS